MTARHHDVIAERIRELEQIVDTLSEELAAIRDDLGHVSRQLASFLRHPSAAQPIDAERAIAESRREKLC